MPATAGKPDKVVSCFSAKVQVMLDTGREMLVRMDPKNYAEHWEKESTLYESQGVYQRLSAITPDGNVLEIGAGVGLATVALAATRAVLALDSNLDLAEKARSRIRSSGAKAEIVITDFLAPSTEAVERIKEFAPAVIVGWFLGSNADDQEKYAADVPWDERSKKYREHIEDALMAPPLCQPSVEWVHLVGRGGRVLGIPEEEAKQEQAEDYNQYVFHPNGFEVVDVQYLDWDRQGSSFHYGEAPNPNLAPGQTNSLIMSFLAKRRAA
ncbi:conserved hypothetical protein [Cupriavidus taiwanensis]|nr:conserved hypothetical protein [Cupriavidus taiwanensis]